MVRTLFAVALLNSVASSASADVIVLDNRSIARIQAKISPVTARPMSVTIEAGEVKPIFVDGKAYISYTSQRKQERFLLDPNSVYFLGNRKGGGLGIQKIGLGGPAGSAAGRKLKGSPNNTSVQTIPVKILVDEEEPSKQRVWEAKLRRRVDQASAIMEKHCRLRFKVITAETWNSDNRITDFFDSFAEFEKEVKPFPAQLAIGFTSQYQVPKGRTHLGGTRGLLQSHIMIREWSQHISEAERMELLVHELGHFMGAMHSPERTSVMRPVLGDRLSIRKNFLVRFDPVNTLVMSMIVEEMRRGSVRKPTNLSRGTMQRLGQIYASMGQAERLAAGGGKSPARERISAERKLPKRNRKKKVEYKPSPQVEAAQKVLGAIVTSARKNYKLAKAENEGEPLTGDALTEYYVRAAAAAAKTVPEEYAEAAFLMGLGLGLDDSDALHKVPKTKRLAGTIEPPGNRSVRRAFLGNPTMAGRSDLTKHFVISAYLTAVQGSQAAQEAGLAKELFDTRPGGSKFSFVDLTADRAGILFAAVILQKQISLAQMAEEFTVADYLPATDDGQEGLTAVDISARYGDAKDERFQAKLREIDQTIKQLSPYRSLTTEKLTTEQSTAR